MLQDAAQMKLDVLSTVHFTVEAWRLLTLTTVKNFFVKCGFSTDHVSSNDDGVMELSEDEEDYWHSFQPLEVQSEDYSTCGSVLEACGVQSVNQVLGQHLTRPEEEEEVIEHKATFLDALKGLEAARKYICRFDMENNIIVMCNEAENELYRQSSRKKIRAKC
jgi:hypothetical protein